MSVWISEGLFYQVTASLYPVSTKTADGVKWGYINSRGKLQIKQDYDQAMEFQTNGLAVVRLNNHFGVINHNGKFVVEPRYEMISLFSEGRAQVIDKGNYKVIDTSGKVLTSKFYSLIGAYESGRALFAETTEGGQHRYGYLDRQGKEVIPAQFINGNDFQNDKAVVQLSANEYAIINRIGKILNKYPYPFVGNLGDGLLPFKENEDGKLGYMDVKGTIIIQPQYTIAMPFEEGYAIVNKGEDYKQQYGLINKEGKFMIAPTYNDIHLVGKNRVAVGKAIKEESPFYGSKYALATIDGTVFTDYKYFTILDFKEGVASATTGMETFFMLRNGKMAKDLPVVKGEGTLTLEGELVKANVDQRLSYYNRSGALVWRQNRLIPLNQQYKVVEKKYKPNKDYLVYYPQVEGMASVSAQQKVNEELKQLAQVKPIQAEVQLDSSYTGDFAIQFHKEQLLVIEIEGYDYPFGAAHGMPYRVYASINLVTGSIYELADLFRKDSDYVKELSTIIAEQIEKDEQYSYVFPNAYKGISADQLFYIDANNLYLYFEPYEIGPYAAGFPTFTIPFTEIKDIINFQGEFWQAFH
ncbi:WG repeat-containing protein [Schinkia sp. CFF1]